jgi:hypothetical protein
VGSLVLLSLASLIVVNPHLGLGMELTGGYVLGTFFGHPTLAAAWAAFGPGRLAWRVPLSLIWIALLAICLSINISMHGGPEDAPLLLGLGALGQWLLLQIPLFALAVGFGMQIRHVDESAGAFDPRQWQFGTRQLVIVTAVVAVLLGIVRLTLSNLSPEIFIRASEAAALAILVGSANVLTLPLLLSGLMRHHPVRGVLFTLTLLCFATTWELRLLRAYPIAGGPSGLELLAINAVLAALVLTFVTTVRLSGYCLSRGNSEPSSAAA